MMYASEELARAAADEKSREMDEDWSTIEFEGHNCDDACSGWNGNSKRCACGNRRVDWALTEHAKDIWPFYAEANCQSLGILLYWHHGTAKRHPPKCTGTFTGQCIRRRRASVPAQGVPPTGPRKFSWLNLRFSSWSSAKRSCSMASLKVKPLLTSRLAWMT